MVSSAMAAVAVAFAVVVAATMSSAQLDPHFYDGLCPAALPTIKRIVEEAVAAEPRMGASLLRLHFHDCFVNGCDGSILLDDTPFFTGEKNAAPNMNSVRGFDVIDRIKDAVNAACRRNGRADGEPGGGEQQHPGADAQPRRPRLQLRRAGPLRAGPRPPLRRPHAGLLPLHQLPRPPLQRDGHARRLPRRVARGDLPAYRRRRRRQPRAARPDAGEVRRRVLRLAAARQGAPALGPAAVRRRRPRRQPGRVPARLRRVHGEDGQPEPARREPRRGPRQLQEGELLLARTRDGLN
ncbi:Os03g0339400 [Oryza sativa Japonica Group]|uniref:Peroxidase n=2 Tax=Oryza sativa subsp. japonica TaxID=39947 RepID=C7IZT8_ORYSJ|nr:Os03g0339400 [Oryza sativa Japonica Group]BAS84111.1 Os03g0339400 [Oryza sativa Japonica Group]|eukprot:NP_001173411.1 Os03g0339400 [Oryza sativa Japonica Group]